MNEIIINLMIAAALIALRELCYRDLSQNNNCETSCELLQT